MMPCKYVCIVSSFSRDVYALASLGQTVSIRSDRKQRFLLDSPLRCIANLVAFINPYDSAFMYFI